ncbi:MAG TPA: glutathione peroxidase [Bacteroidales bacterium]|nr:glutathione peroxidase [Bacteroidales bacterium]
MEDYKGKVLLIVNTASKCGFTPQYEGLQHLYDKYKEKGLVILGFPCNQFASQEPADNATINNFCKLNYGVTFPMFSKIKVNGRNAHPLYKFLKKNAGGLLVNTIKWNFTKFLIDREGNVVKRYAPSTTPESLEKEMINYL